MANTTSTCYCGTVQLEYSIEGDNFIDSFICHCTDDRKITSSMFATNFYVKNDTLHYTRGEDKITKFTQKPGFIASGNSMTNHFCSVCGSLMFRVSSGFPGTTILRLGQVDDFKLHEGRLKPRTETFAKDRVAWAKPAEGVLQKEGNYYIEEWKGSGDK